MNMFLAQSDAANTAVGFGAILVIVSLVVAITWTVFPFIVIAKFNRILRGMEMMLYELKNRPKP